MAVAGSNEKAMHQVTPPNRGNTGPPALPPYLDWSTLQGAAHCVQFYEEDSFLLHSLSDFVASGLRAGETVITLATAAHRMSLNQRLQMEGLELEALRATGQLVERDAAETLRAIMDDGAPDARRFNDVIGTLLTQAATRSRPVRVFGELVALLWRDARYDAALHLEGLWNELLKSRRLLLFCAYPIDGSGKEALPKPLSDVCGQHTHVFPAESYTALAGTNERSRAIVLLQQKASLLEAEIAKGEAAREQLRSSEIRYRRLFEASTAGILLVDLGTQKIKDANPCINSLLDLTQEELVGKELWEVGLFPDQETAREALQELHKQQVMHYEPLTIRTSSGQQRDIELVSNMYQANGRQVVQCNLRDITSRRQAEEALHAVKEELESQVADLRRLHEMSIRLTSSLDIESVLQEVLRAALSVQGTNMGLLYLCRPPCTELQIKIHSGFDQAYLDAFARVRTGEGACGACLERQQRVVVENVEQDPIFVRDRAAALAAGFRACHSTPLITRSGTVTGVLSVHFPRPHRPSEREIHLLDLYARMAADFIENARLHHELQQELKAHEQLLEREHAARADAESANRMKDEFLMTISHELRTPLTTIIGWSQRLRIGNRDEAMITRGLEMIERSAKTQAQLIEDILDVSRIITGKLRLSISPVDAATVINAAIDSLQLAADSKGITLEVILEPSARHISGDANRLQQVFWNLLSNAVKFTPSGGRVKVRLERAGTHVQISVSDTGEGISAELLPFIFERFRQVDGSNTRRHGGLGLGLAIARHLVELHGGTVHVDSPGEGMGATFTVRLPLANSAARAKNRQRGARKTTSAQQPDAKEAARPSLNGIQLLLVDDNQDSLRPLAIILREHQAEVQTATSVGEALELLRWYRPHVLVSSLDMRGEDGSALMSRLRALEAESGRRIPALALTAHGRTEDRVQAAEGLIKFIPKPVEPAELVSLVASLVAPGAP